MSNEKKELYEFGPFRLDTEKRLLLRNEEPVPLQLKAFETLLVLVRNSQQVVMKDELMKAVWPDSFVEESNLSQNIFVLRKTLASSGGNNRYIVTIPGRGYRFAEAVRVISEQEALVLQRRSRAHIVVDEKIHQTASRPVAVQVQAQPRRPHLNRPGLVAVTVVELVLALGAIAYIFRPAVPPPRVTRIQQITHVGNLVHNTHLLTDGPRIYFRIRNGKKRDLRSVSTGGGEAVPVEMPLPDSDLDDISRDGTEFLAVNMADAEPAPEEAGLNYFSFWRIPVPVGSPRPIGLHGRESTWSPDGRTIAYSRAKGLFQANIDGSHSTQLASLPDHPFYLRWAPDGKQIRYTAVDQKDTGYSIWQTDLATHATSVLIPDLPPSARPWAGDWTPDGKYYFYSAEAGGTRNLYAVREKKSLLERTDSRPVQLTNGPFTFYVPLPSKDGKRLFVVGDQMRGELVRYDSATRQYQPVVPTLSADELDYSRDGKWMAYVEFPEGTLVRSRADGSERQQLTFPPMRALNPQWSPDGTQIAFQATADAGAKSKIYVVAAAGGVPQLATSASDNHQSNPSWTSDGASLLFASADPSRTKFDLLWLDLKSRQVSPVPGSDGLYFGQISPDGRNIVALTKSTDALVLYSVGTHATRTLAEAANSPRWSSDGKFVYFNNAYFNRVGRNGGVCRWNSITNAVETLLKYPEFTLTGAFGVTFGLSPDGSILLLKDASNRDLFALDLDLP